MKVFNKDVWFGGQKMHPLISENCPMRSRHVKEFMGHHQLM